MLALQNEIRSVLSSLVFVEYSVNNFIAKIGKLIEMK